MKLSAGGLLHEKAVEAREQLRNCGLCPRRCGVDRTCGETGFCGMGDKLVVGSVNLHFGEEPPLSGAQGSGTVFFSGCTMACVYCQNYPLSHLHNGREYAPEQLARELLNLQARGANNVNLVTATQLLPLFLEALETAVREGLRIPIVYNTSGYESLETLKLLEGIVDIYLPDIRYADNAAALKFSLAGDYVEVNRSALKEMFRQVGHLETDGNGIGVRGLIVRHLVLPDGVAGSEDSLGFLMRTFGPELNIGLMGQYFPAHQALHTKPLDRKITHDEYQSVVDLARELGFENGWFQCDGDFDDED